MPRRLLARALVLAAAAGLASFASVPACAAERVTIEQISVEVPEKWSRAESRTGCAAVFKSDAVHLEGEARRQDVITVRVLPASGNTLDQFEALMKDVMKKQAKELSDLALQQSPLKVDIEKLGKYEYTRVKLEGVEALRMEGMSLLKVAGELVKTHNVTHVLLLADKFYVIATGSPASRRKAVEAAQKKFITSIRIEADK